MTLVVTPGASSMRDGWDLTPVVSHTGTLVHSGIWRRRQLYAVGCRNMWRCSWDKITHRLFCGDVGQVRSHLSSPRGYFQASLPQPLLLAARPGEPYVALNDAVPLRGGGHYSTGGKLRLEGLGGGIVSQRKRVRGAFDVCWSATAT